MSKKKQERDITTVGIPKALKQRFHALKRSKDYHSFAEFVREAVRLKIERYEES